MLPLMLHVCVSLPLHDFFTYNRFAVSFLDKIPLQEFFFAPPSPPPQFISNDPSLISF